LTPHRLGIDHSVTPQPDRWPWSEIICSPPVDQICSQQLSAINVSAIRPAVDPDQKWLYDRWLLAKPTRRHDAHSMARST